MSETKHTPGSWRVGRTITGSEDIQLWGLTGNGREKYDCFVVAPAYTVAEVSGIGKGECRANARLIAAAPDLLAACKGMVEWFAGMDDITLEDGASEAIAAARAAIALADGGPKKSIEIPRAP
jgi:hypothetical protein